MPWCHAILRGARVFARCNESGELDVRSGRVEIRYKPTDGRAYQASPRNLEPVSGSPVLPDDHCVEGEPAAKARGKGTATKSKGKSKAAAKAGSVTHRSEPDGDEVLIYADGACSGNPGPAGLGVVMRFDDEWWELSEYLGAGTNNIAELTAIMRAARASADKGRPVRIHTDSRYSIGVLTQGWKAKANRELVAEVKEALAQLDDVELVHVPGHAGVALNERADELAREAIVSKHTAEWRRADRQTA